MRCVDVTGDMAWTLPPPRSSAPSTTTTGGPCSWAAATLQVRNVAGPRSPLASSATCTDTIGQATSWRWFGKSTQNT